MDGCTRDVKAIRAMGFPVFHGGIAPLDSKGRGRVMAIVAPGLGGATRREIDALPALELAAEYRRLEQQLLAKWDAPLVNDFLCMIAFGAAQKAMTKWAGDDGVVFLGGMLIGQGDIISAEPAPPR